MDTQSTNGNGVSSRELTAGNTGPDGSNTEVKYQIYSPKICGYNSRYLKANRSTLKQKQGQNGAWDSRLQLIVKKEKGRDISVAKVLSTQARGPERQSSASMT